jgi:lipid-binding SYLF domain-containing protein
MGEAKADAAREPRGRTTRGGDMTRLTRSLAAILIAGATVLFLPSRPARAASAAELTRNGKNALQDLYAGQPAARDLGKKAKAILVFPNIVKAGFMFGGQIGEGVLLKNGQPAGFYNSVAASYGFQAGVQTFGYALFFLTDEALAYINKSDGFEIGIGPSVVIVDEGVARTLTTTTVRDNIYAFIFDQKGLMAGAGVQGSKITRIDK